MKTRYRQQGASMLAILAIVGTAAFFLMTAFKIIPVYIEAGNIRSVMNNLKNEPGLTNMSKQKIKSKLSTALSVSGQRGVDLSALEVKSESDRMIITFNYDKRVPWIQNIDLMLHFENEYVAVKQ